MKKSLSIFLTLMMLFTLILFPLQVYAIDDVPISIAAIPGVTVPVKGETPVSTLADTAEYSATISWSPADATFAPDTEYTATITITPLAGFTLTGVTENFFTVDGATATNAADTGVVTAIFPKTATDDVFFVSATTDETGGTITMTFDKTMADPSAEAGSFAVVVNGYSYGSPAGTWPYTISSAALNADTAKIDLVLDTPVQRGDIVTVSYTPGAVEAEDGSDLDAFGPQTVTNTIPVVLDTNLVGTWQIYDHVGNWGEVPYPTGDDPRGNIYNRHIVINDGEVIFYGYGVPSYKDFLFMPSDETAAKSFAFDLDLSGIDYHSMEGGGFLFNTQIDGGLLSGYCALFTNYYGNYAVKLYQIDEFNVNDFHEGSFYSFEYLPTGITLLGTFPMSAENLHSIMLQASSDTVDLWDGPTKLIDNFSLPTAYGNGVGIIASYNSHWCSMLSYFKFSNLNIQSVADLAAELDGTKAHLTFTAPEGATSVTVEQSTDGITFTPATTSSPITEASTTATVTGLTANQTYYFRLVIDGGKYAGVSRIATAEYIPLPISDLVGRPGDKKAYLTFSAPIGATGVTVMQSTDGGATYEPAELFAPVTDTSTRATVLGLQNGVEYTFRLALVGGGYDGNSNSVTVKPKASGGGAAPAPNILRFNIGIPDSYLTLGTEPEQTLPMDVAPILYENRTLLPIRYVVEPLGGSLTWDPAEQKVTITRGNTTIELWIGNNMAKVNGVSRMIDPDNPAVKPLIINPGRTMMPLRFISEALGCTVDWVPLLQKVLVSNW